MITRYGLKCKTLKFTWHHFCTISNNWNPFIVVCPQNVCKNILSHFVLNGQFNLNRTTPHTFYYNLTIFIASSSSCKTSFNEKANCPEELVIKLEIHYLVTSRGLFHKTLVKYCHKLLNVPNLCAQNWAVFSDSNFTNM